VTIHLNPKYFKAKTFVIKTNGNNSDSPYIENANLNGLPLKTWQIRHSNIQKGAKLEFEMSNKPNKNLWR